MIHPKVEETAAALTDIIDRVTLAGLTVREKKLLTDGFINLALAASLDALTTQVEARK